MREQLLLSSLLETTAVDVLSSSSDSDSALSCCAWAFEAMRSSMKVLKKSPTLAPDPPELLELPELPKRERKLSSEESEVESEVEVEVEDGDEVVEFEATVVPPVPPRREN